MSEFDVTLAYDGIAVDPGSPKMRKKGCRDPRPRRARRQPELAVRTDWCSDLCFRDDRPFPDVLQEAPVGSGNDHRAASEFEAAVPSTKCSATKWTLSSGS